MLDLQDEKARVEAVAQGNRSFFNAESRVGCKTREHFLSLSSALRTRLADMDDEKIHTSESDSLFFFFFSAINGQTA